MIVALSLAVGALGGGAAGYLVARGVESDTRSSALSQEARTSALDVGAIVDMIEPSVVSVRTTTTVRRGPFTTETEGAGTGIVIDDAGLVITNAHVVSDAVTTNVVLDDDDRARAATVIATDSASDVALLRVDDHDGLVAADLANDLTTLEVGDPVVAVGNALDLDGAMTVTAGIVSALDRSITTSDGELDDLIQTDAAISSGNSGGPLVNGAGQVVGMNTAVATSQGTTQASNIGFAISLDTVLDVVERLLHGETA